jgi:hypothetical protein
MSNTDVLVELLGKVGEQAVKVAEGLRVEYFKSYKQDVEIWNKEMVPNFNYVRLAVMSVYSTGKSFGDFSQQEVESVINTQPKWEKSINNLAQLAATKITKK